MSLLAIFAAEPIPLSECLEPIGLVHRRSGPSLEPHFDVWSRAIYRGDAWEMASGAASSTEKPFHALLAKANEGVVLVSDIRERHSDTAVRPSLCRRERWVFSHDGAIEDRGYLSSRTAPTRACPGETDSDLLLAFMLSRLDECDLAASVARDAVDEVIRAAATEILRRIGSLSFFLSDGTALYAHRFDRSLYVCERGSGGSQPAAVVLASEPVTNEGWVPLKDRTLLRCASHSASGSERPTLDLVFLSGRDPRPSSDVELPFTD